jgi:hypothetical protein
MTPAVWVGAVLVAVGSLAAFAIGRKPRTTEQVAAVELEPALDVAA